MHQIFVYGTLKRGYPNHQPWMETTRFLGTYRSAEAFPLVIGGQWFQIFLLPEPGVGFQVAGELYETDDAGLAALDKLESTHLPNGYLRQKIAVVSSVETDGTNTATDTAVNVWVYFKDRASIETIHDGPMAEYPLDRRYVPVSERG